MSDMPDTARELILNLPERFKKEEVGDFSARVHLTLEGDGGGNFTVVIENGSCTVEEGLLGVPDCVVRSKASTYLEAETGKLNPTMAVMMGKIKVSNIGVMSQFITKFKRLS